MVVLVPIVDKGHLGLGRDQAGPRSFLEGGGCFESDWSSLLLGHLAGGAHHLLSVAGIHLARARSTQFLPIDVVNVVVVVTLSTALLFLLLHFVC